MKSRAFTKRRERTKTDYLKQIAKIQSAFGALPLDALEDPRVTKDFLDWRDGMASSPRQADYAWTVLMRIISWASGQGGTTYRPPERLERLYHGDRSEKIWTEEHVAAFMAQAPVPLQRALVLALDTGQRQGDLLVLPCSAYDPRSPARVIRLTQSKGGQSVRVPVTRLLRSVLDNTPRNSPVILTHGRGLPWQPNAFRKAWGKATRRAGISDLTFHDLRGRVRPDVFRRRSPLSQGIRCGT